MAILYTYKDAIFGNLLDVQDDYEEGRSFSYAYYSHEYLSNWMSILFGNGLGHKSSIYGNTIEYFEGKRVILADIGILGTLYYWGAIYVFTYIVLLLRLFFSKWLATSYKSYIVYIFLRLLVITPLWEFAGMVEQGLFVYLCFANINKNKLAYGQKEIKYDVSVIIVTYNTFTLTSDCIKVLSITQKIYHLRLFSLTMHQLMVVGNISQEINASNTYIMMLMQASVLRIT